VRQIAAASNRSIKPLLQQNCREHQMVRSVIYTVIAWLSISFTARAEFPLLARPLVGPSGGDIRGGDPTSNSFEGPTYLRRLRHHFPAIQVVFCPHVALY
jgi:hypothetical protein